jgi:RimJ/RimL family protein N-acetyltransferase
MTATSTCPPPRSTGWSGTPERLALQVLSALGAHWAVVEAESGILLGRAALKHLKFADGTAEVAYWTVPAARGKGVCPRAVDAMASWAFEVAGFHRLDLEHAIGNTGSCRVAEKTGFAVEGVRRSAWLQADGRHDVHAHARLRCSPGQKIDGSRGSEPGCVPARPG